MAYLLTLLTLTEDYSDCCYYTDQDYNASYNRLQYYVLFFSDNYIVAGYETPEEYYRAISAGECERPSETFFILFDRTMRINPQKKQSEGDKNIWPSLFANANSAN